MNRDTERHVVLVSGGEDSTVAAHHVCEQLDADVKVLVYLDTRTGCEENRQYCEELADSLGKQLWTLRTQESYEDAVKEHGFPGPSRHFIMYRKLKERQIGKLATMTGGRLHLWTGVRKQESSRRMKHVEPEQEADRWTWHAPLAFHSKRWVRAYIDDHNLPENPLWETLGRSADCFCGAYGNREELIDATAAGCTEVPEKIERIESEIDHGDQTDKWAHGSLSDPERRALRVGDEQIPLCSSCEVQNNAKD
jgi:3'-phosphoadenosine 5'-phosphosulfate sulfotransferase (PAPS reductase)/FAD synthetase